MAAIKTSYKTKNWLNVYRREEHKKLSLVPINNFPLPKAERLKNMDNAYCDVWFIFIRLFEYRYDDMLRHGFV
jgi:hypothetical protein